MPASFLESGILVHARQMVSTHDQSPVKTLGTESLMGFQDKGTCLSVPPGWVGGGEKERASLCMALSDAIWDFPWLIPLCGLLM